MMWVIGDVGTRGPAGIVPEPNVRFLSLPIDVNSQVKYHHLSLSSMRYT